MTQYITEQMIGRTYNYLTIISISPKRPKRWTCKCVCGKEIELIRSAIIYNKRKSCGCKRKVVFSKHGYANHRIYKVWGSLLQRCNNKNDHAYKYYGGRGIKVCDRWLDFENFLSDMSPIPDNLSLDRIDNNKDYSPDNVRWATQKQQLRNRRTTVMLTYNGDTKCIDEWVDILGMSKECLRGRLRRGWSVEKSFNTSILSRP